MKSSNGMAKVNGITKGRELKGESGNHDCSVRTFAHAFDIDYTTAHEFVEKNFGRKTNKGCPNYHSTIDGFIKKRKKLNGKSFKKVEPKQYTNTYGRNVRQSTLARFVEKNPEGLFILSVRKHTFVVKDGVVMDGTRPKTKVLKAWEVK